ncbi:MAG: glyoxylate/hydroxypyruvate reductase A [Pseudomonadota bacterium]
MSPVNVLFAGHPDRWPEYEAPLTEALAEAGVTAQVTPTFDDPVSVSYVVYAPNGPYTDLSPFTRLKAVLSLWAGVEDIVTNPTLTVPLARMVDPGLTEGMVEWVTAHVLRHHLETDLDVLRAPGDWTPRVPPLARDRRVTVLGLGALGAASAAALAALGFRVSGWSRSPKSLPGITCHFGPEGLAQILNDTQILVLLLPATPETDGILGAEMLAGMPEGAVILNPGRGPLIDDAALLAALDAGRIAHATLDVFRQEPLPKSHPYWSHPRVTITPHIASATRPGTAVRAIAENVRRGEAGEPLLNLVDRTLGY